MMRKLLSLGLTATTVISNPVEIHNETNDKEFIKYSVVEEQNNDVDVVVRCGEFDGKAGKRIYCNISQLNIPNDIPIHYDENGSYIAEFDINNKISTQLHRKLSEKGLNSILQIANGKSEDLNAAGRIAKESNPDVYLSIHTNAYAEDSEGYFFMYNSGDFKSEKVANELSKAMTNDMVKTNNNRINEDYYVGELSEFKGEDCIAILGELGYYSNLNELQKIISDEYVEYITDQMANELYDVVNNK